MKNILGTEENLELFNEDGKKVYEYFKHPFGYSYEYTRDSNGNELSYKNSNGYWYEYTYDSNGKELTFKDSYGTWYERTYDSNGKVLTFKDSKGFSREYTRDSQGNELTYKDSNGESRGFDKTYTPEEVEFIKRAVNEYWEHCFAEHPDNQNDLKLTQQILNK